MNTELLQALLAAWPTDEAVRVRDANGHIVAQNGRSLEAAARGFGPRGISSGEFWKAPQVRERSLLHGWHLQARPVLSKGAQHAAQHTAQQAVQQAAPHFCAEHAEPTAGSVASGHFPDAPPRVAPASGDKSIEMQILARGMVHELRNPLAAIVTAAGLIQDDAESSEETVMLMGVIRKESHRMNRILSEFAAYVKPRPPQPRPFDLVESVQQEARDVMSEREEFQGPVEIEDLLPPRLHVLADEDHLRDVVRHVLRNSSEAMAGGGRLRLEASTIDGTARLQISDTGAGLSPDALKRAFQPFFSSKSQSTGLGLSIARSAAEASGGRIWIENIESAKAPEGEPQGSTKGARVFIELPITHEAHGQE